MNLKKLFYTMLVLLFLLTSTAFAANMKIFPLTSPIYSFIEDLYKLEGLSAPQGAKPWTEADVKQQLARITPSTETSEYMYSKIESLIGDSTKEVHGDWNCIFTPTLALHNNTTDFNTSSSWKYDSSNEKLVRFNAGFYIKDYFASNFGASLGFVNSSNMRGYKKGADKSITRPNNEPRFKNVFSTNIPFVSEGAFDLDFTDNSYVNLGNKYISATLGRGQLSLGNGTMGNLVLGNTLPYHDFIRISASNNTWFDYTFLVNFYPHPMNYYQGFTAQINGIQLFIAHRFEFRMATDKLRIALNEALMYQSESNTVDFRVFNPLLIMHGYYIPANGNSLLSLELDYAPIKNLQLYASFVLDDYAVPGAEPQPPENDATLNMWGIMGGINGTVPITNKGYLDMNLEAVYTSPFMYHKDTYGSHDYSLDFIGTVRLCNGKYVRRYLSLPFGSDALAINAKITYKQPLRYSFGGNIFFMMHGITNEYSVAKKYGPEGGSVPGFLMSENPFDPTDKGEITYTINAGINGEFYFLDNLKLFSTFDFITNINSKTSYDCQFTLGMKYSII